MVAHFFISQQEHTLSVLITQHIFTKIGIAYNIFILIIRKRVYILVLQLLFSKLQVKTLNLMFNHLILTLMKNILKLIDGKLIKVRPLPQFTDRSPLVMPFIDEPISTYTRAKNTLTHIFTSKRCKNTIFIGDVTSMNGKWNWYSAQIINATSILQSNI